MATRRKNSKSAAERAEQVQELKAMFEGFSAEQSAEQIAMITAKFDGYSERNAMLIAAQRPDATDVSGFHAWQDRGRRVMKGEHGIKILAPAGMGWDKSAQHHDEMITQNAVSGHDQPEEVRFFRVAYVFDISQTETEAEFAAKQQAVA
jgi:hypothetical protein